MIDSIISYSYSLGPFATQFRICSWWWWIIKLRAKIPLCPSRNKNAIGNYVIPKPSLVLPAHLLACQRRRSDDIEWVAGPRECTSGGRTFLCGVPHHVSIALLYSADQKVFTGDIIQRVSVFVFARSILWTDQKRRRRRTIGNSRAKALS